MAPHYRHTQVGWVIIGSIAAALLLVVPLVAVGGAPAGVLFGAGSLAITGVLFATLTVEVDEREIRVRFTGGLVRRRVALADLRRQRPVRNPWLYGWGIHMIPGGWIWNVSGLDAVELTLANGRVLRVGTDEPQALSRAIAQVAPAAGPPEVGPRATQHRRRGPLFVLAVAAGVVGAVGALVAPFSLQVRPPEVVLGEQHLSVRSLFYGDDYPLAEITGVSLEERLPPILARTNGFAGGRQLRGWFRLEALGEGELFVDLAAPPFLLMRLRRGFVIVNYSDPERTRALHAEIERRRQP